LIRSLFILQWCLSLKIYGIKYTSTIQLIGQIYFLWDHARGSDAGTTIKCQG